MHHHAAAATEKKLFYDPNTRQYFYTENLPHQHHHHQHHQIHHPQPQQPRVHTHFRPNMTHSGVFTNPNFHPYRNQPFNRSASNTSNNINNGNEFNNNNNNESNEPKTSVIITEVSDDEEENEFKLKAKNDKSNYVDAISLNGEEEELESESETNKK